MTNTDPPGAQVEMRGDKHVGQRTSGRSVHLQSRPGMRTVLSGPEKHSGVSGMVSKKEKGGSRSWR